MKTIGCSKDPARIEQLKLDAQFHIEEQMGQSALAPTENRPDRYGAIFERIEAVRLLGPGLLLGKVFETIGFGQLPTLPVSGQCTYRVSGRQAQDRALLGGTPRSGP